MKYQDKVDSLAREYLANYKRQGNPAATECSRNWQGQNYKWQQPNIGHVFPQSGDYWNSPACPGVLSCCFTDTDGARYVVILPAPEEIKRMAAQEAA